MKLKIKKHLFEIVSGDPTIEAITLINDVMARYPEANKDAIRGWFVAEINKPTAKNEWFPSVSDHLP